MPVCYYFLYGVCSNEQCPYSHVKVNAKADVCSDFVKGYCPRGTSCKLKHTLRCPEFANGKCPYGENCKMQHSLKRKIETIILDDPVPTKKIKPCFSDST
eukprot:TRINITY_DN2225_c0_g1_i1.p1 TRINITY_DN2225_c0_g1~~TRINITY_DN2225_c0_g1_i1.p1  ORF type:complete len:100 (-),score=4.80 TRINITY_DN2225_c0_g1_i1:51-350(-)